MARLLEYVRRVEMADGSFRYEARINFRKRGERTQLRRRFSTVAAASDWYTRTAAELVTGTHIAAADLTVKQAIEAWLQAKALRVKPTTLDAGMPNKDTHQNVHVDPLGDPYRSPRRCSCSLVLQKALRLVLREFL